MWGLFLSTIFITTVAHAFLLLLSTDSLSNIQKVSVVCAAFMLMIYQFVMLMQIPAVSEFFYEVIK